MQDLENFDTIRPHTSAEDPAFVPNGDAPSTDI